jgi:hypothetical protein
LRVMKSIYVESGIKNPTANQLFNGITALTGGGFHNLSVSDVERSLITTKYISSTTGIPVATREQLERLE